MKLVYNIYAESEFDLFTNNTSKATGIHDVRRVGPA